VNATVVPSIGISDIPGDTICVGTPVTFTAISFNGGASPSFTWIRNSLFAAAGSSYTVTPITGDNVYCRMASSLACISADTVSSNHIIMVVEDSLISPLTITGHPGLSIAAGQQDTLIAATSGGCSSLSYQWYINGVIVSGATNATYISDTFVNHDSVTCLVICENLCANSQSHSVIVYVDPLEASSVVASKTEVMLLPNPNKGDFTISGKIAITNSKEVNIQVTDLLSQVVYFDKLITSDGTLNKHISLNTHLPSGLYFVNINSDKDTKVFRFILQK
jgi:hypothetical protein